MFSDIELIEIYIVRAAPTILRMIVKSGNEHH